MIGTAQRQAIISKICKSQTFCHAPTSVALLKYLFKSSSQNTGLKESIIEMEFFGQKASPGKNSPKVRVNVYNLRKKINQYYQDEGKKDPYRIHIDKGQYHVRFEKVNNSGSITQLFRSRSAFPYSLAIISILVAVITNIPPRKPGIWEPFLTNKSTTLYIGDVFGMIGTTITGNFGWTRDYSINTPEEYYQLCEDQPDLKDQLLPPPYTYLTQMGVSATKNIQELFSTHQSDFKIRYTSRTSIDEIKSTHAIYAGPIKNNNPFIQFFNKENQWFNLRDSILFLKNHPQIPDTTFNFPYRVHNKELAIVSRIPGPVNTEQFLFFANHDMGVSATIQYFTDENLSSGFTKKYLNDSRYFTAVFRARGVNRMDTDLQVVMVVPLNINN